MKEPIIIVDNNDSIIWYRERWKLKKWDIYRVSSLIVFNKKWEFLMAQRSLQKRNSPGIWNTSVAWTNDKWETYLSNIIKEAKEEIGLDLNVKEIKELFKTKNIRNDHKNEYFCSRYGVVLDYNEEDCSLQADEVDAVRFMNVKTLWIEMKKSPKIYSKWFYNVITQVIKNM